MIIKQVRSWVPVVGLVALAVLFLNLPEAPSVFATLGCKTCSSSDPYVPLIGAGYFAVLVATALLFPTFPGPLMGRAGLTWAVLLALAMTYVKWPGWCLVCLIGHACNVAIWTIWLAVPPATGESPASTVRERLCLTLLVPTAIVALFSSINLTFMAYGFKVPTAPATSLQAGDTVPTFTAQTTGGRPLADTDAAQAAGLVINFISPDCHYCKEQLPVLNAVASQLGRGSCRFVNVSPALPPDLVQRSPTTEWVEDREGKLRELFQVSGYPTLFVVGTDGKIAQVFPGVPEQLKASLLSSLRQAAGQ